MHDRPSLAAAVLLACALTLFAGCAAAPSPDATAPRGLSGTVTDERGEPAAGAFVTARDTSTDRSFSVRSRADGTYHLPVEHEGPLVVTVHGIGLVDGRAELVAELPARLDLTASRTDSTFDQLPSSAYLGALPDGEIKRRFILDCGGCHQFNRVRAREGQSAAGPLAHPRDYWRTWTAQMLSFAGARTSFPVIAPGRDPDGTAAWLSEHLGEPGAPPPTVSRPAFDLSPERVLVTEYDVPIPSDLPHDLMPDEQGRIVVTGMMSGRMYTLDPVTGAWTHHEGFANPRALAIDEAGAWWVLLGAPRQITCYRPEAKTRSTFDIGAYPHSIALADDGRVWFNAHFSKDPETLGVLEPGTGTVQTFEVPTPPQPDGGTTIPYGLRLDADGVLWGTQLLGNRLVRFDPATEAFNLYDLPTPHSGPRRLDPGPDDKIWIPLFASGKLAAFDPSSETFTEYEIPVSDALPYIVRAAPDGVVWVATGGADAVFRFFPDEHRWTVHPLPTRSALVRHMELDAEGAAWVAYGNSPAVAPKVAKVEVLGAASPGD